MGVPGMAPVRGVGVPEEMEESFADGAGEGAGAGGMSTLSMT